MTSCWLRTDRSDIMAAALEGLAGAAASRTRRPAPACWARAGGSAKTAST